MVSQSSRTNCPKLSLSLSGTQFWWSLVALHDVVKEGDKCTVYNLSNITSGRILTIEIFYCFYLYVLNSGGYEYPTSLKCTTWLLEGSTTIAMGSINSVMYDFLSLSSLQELIIIKLQAIRRIECSLFISMNLICECRQWPRCYIYNLQDLQLWCHFPTAIFVQYQTLHSENIHCQLHPGYRKNSPTSWMRW